MAIVNGSLELGYKNTAWFTANPTLVLKEGQIVYLEQTGTYKIGNGSTQLSALSFLGISSETQTLQNVTDLGNFTTNNIETAGITTDYVQLDTTATTTGAVGKLTWNDVDGTANLGLKGGNVTLQIGQEFLARVVNKTATNISLLESNYQAVRITGAIGQRPKVDLALADNDLNSATTLGLVTETIANNAEGFITTSGQVKEINTTGSLQGETWVDGDTLYLSGTVAGMITNIKPSAPIHTVIIGFVEYAHAIHGKIFVKVNNGYELEELHNVSAIAPNNNEVLTYETSSTLWKPKTVVSALGFTPYNATNPDGFISGITSGMVITALGFTPYNSTNPSGYITGITSGNVTTALGFTPYDASNPSGYITSSDLSPYALIVNPTFTTAITTPIVNGVSGNLAFANTVRTSGAITAFTFTKPNNTTQTASTSISGFVVNGGTRQWNTGNITAQSENVWGATTYSFVGASTITNAYGNVFNAPIAGTNCTITNNWAAQFNGNVDLGTNILRVGNGTVSNTAIQLGATANLGLYSSSANKIDFVTQGVTRMSINADGTVVMGSATTNVIGNTYLDYATNSTGIRFTSTTLTLSTGTGTPGTGINYMRMFQTGNIVIQNGGTFTDNGFRLDVNGTCRFQNTLTLATGTTTIAPLKLTAGTNLTTPVNGSFEFDGTNLYFTVGGVRKTVTLI